MYNIGMPKLNSVLSATLHPSLLQELFSVAEGVEPGKLCYWDPDHCLHYHRSDGPGRNQLGG